jgi:hypothetical protein
MKKGIVFGIMTGILVVMGAGAASAGSSYDPWLEKREWVQDQRIEQGVASGALTPWEARLLDREQQRIQCMEAHMKADGYLTAREKLELHREQNLASLHIWRLKHNGYGR